MQQVLEKKVMFPPPGKYVVAVSGGVDSVVLLDLLKRRGVYELVVVHYDHRMRSDSIQDTKFVKSIAQASGLRYVGGVAKRGQLATEEQARQARYKFLRQVQGKVGAQAIITAHHFDDSFETAFMNAVRGADWQGLVPMHLANSPLRPLLAIKKEQLYAYARHLGLKWREDPSNKDLAIARNFIRQKVIPLYNAHEIKQYQQLVIASQVAQLVIEKWISKNLDKDAKAVSSKRLAFILLPDVISSAVIKTLIRQLGHNITSKLTLKIMLFIKTAVRGKELAVSPELRLYTGDDMITLVKKDSPK